MGNIAIIGSGISGAACARILQASGHHTTVYEKKHIVGGLIKCTVEDGNLFHRVGGHVFNSKDEDVSKWFWSNFNREEEFLFAKRNASIHLNEKFLNYPIEQHLFQMPPHEMATIVTQLLDLRGLQNKNVNEQNFYDFLQNRFGEKLCEQYFIPYNTKIWGVDLRSMPTTWLAGKLPMPTVDEILISNVERASETAMVHSSFYYPKRGGSQFIVDRLLRDVEVRTDDECRSITVSPALTVNDKIYDHIIYTGDIRKIGTILGSSDPVFEQVKGFKSNGTTTVLCSCDANPYSWVYIPDPSVKCHRMIMTGNFSETNNSDQLPSGRTTCTIEFVGEIDQLSVDAALRLLPLNPEKIAVNFEENSYVIQEMDTRFSLNRVRESLEPCNIWLCGRFAEWEYYNMDAAISSAMRVAQKIDARNI